MKLHEESQPIQVLIKIPRDTHGKDAKDLNKTIEDIINSYLVLLTRGIKGTYIYCCDKDLRDYLKSKFKKNL